MSFSWSNLHLAQHWPYWSCPVVPPTGWSPYCWNKCLSALRQNGLVQNWLPLCNNLQITNNNIFCFRICMALSFLKFIYAHISRDVFTQWIKLLFLGKKILLKLWLFFCYIFVSNVFLPHLQTHLSYLLRSDMCHRSRTLIWCLSCISLENAQIFSFVFQR